MKKILLLLLIATSLHAEEVTNFWFSGRQEDWEKKKNEGLVRWVALLNESTNSTPYTTENTNNALLQINFGYTNALGDNVWIAGYTWQKCGGFSLTNRWNELADFCTNNKKFDCGWDMNLSEYMSSREYGRREGGAWTNIVISFVDDIKKVNERKEAYKKEKK